MRYFFKLIVFFIFVIGCAHTSLVYSILPREHLAEANIQITQRPQTAADIAWEKAYQRDKARHDFKMWLVARICSPSFAAEEFYTYVTSFFKSGKQDEQYH